MTRTRVRSISRVPQGCSRCVTIPTIGRSTSACRPTMRECSTACWRASRTYSIWTRIPLPSQQSSAAIRGWLAASDGSRVCECRADGMDSKLPSAPSSDSRHRWPARGRCWAGWLNDLDAASRRAVGNGGCFRARRCWRALQPRVSASRRGAVRQSGRCRAPSRADGSTSVVTQIRVRREKHFAASPALDRGRPSTSPCVRWAIRMRS